MQLPPPLPVLLPVLLGALLGALLGEAASAAPADLAGWIELYSEKRREPLPPAEAQYGIVYFEPEASVPLPPAAQHAVVTRVKEFSPRVLPVPAGSVVRFPNEDPILHNVFSVSPSNPFDVGLYGPGEGREHTFANPGLVRIFCNVHHSMAGYLAVLDTPFFAVPAPDGSFRLSGVPAGRGRLTVWHERADPWTRDLEVPHDAPITVELELSRRRVPAHLNKLGQPYRREGDPYD